ncbi:MAG: hypothetical protein JRJ42_02215 [Deltaproteobacteria bacterium]|nr:hypothetical protein [Deltaproteobacteria bacterium]MBW2018576.1 hypothetical protein [Deltaproteobacteria bacterium]MBW2073312.1 hypothetical protein [Deltaproteobacteria bacterium]
MKEKLRDMTRYIPGLIFILLGLVIVAFPMLLVAFASALLILVGIIAIAIAHKTKRLEDEIGYLFDSEPFEKSFWDQAQKVFYRGPWY